MWHRRSDSFTEKVNIKVAWPFFPEISRKKNGYLAILLVTFLGWLSAPFKWLSDLQLGDEKVTLNHLVISIVADVVMTWVGPQFIGEDESSSKWLLVILSDFILVFCLGWCHTMTPVLAVLEDRGFAVS